MKSLRKNLPDAFLDCHLMVTNPKQWVPDFAKAGASLYSFHLECLVSPSAFSLAVVHGSPPTTSAIF